MVIAQAVKHQGDQFAGGGNDTDVAAAPGADTVADLTVAGMRTDALHGLDRGPAHQPGTLFGDPSTVHGGVRLVVFRGQPGPAGQLAGPPKRVMSPISATNTAARIGPTPGMTRIAV
jgi:hypothetical protein